MSEYKLCPFCGRHIVTVLFETAGAHAPGCRARRSFFAIAAAAKKKRRQLAARKAAETRQQRRLAL